MKGNARTLTIIAVLSATTLTAVGTAYSTYYNTRTNAVLANPNSYMFIGVDSTVTGKADKAIEQAAEHKVLYHESMPLLELDADTSGLNHAQGSEEQSFTVISSRDFNRLAKLQGRDDAISLEGSEAAVLEPAYLEGISPEYVGSSIKLKGEGINETIQFKTLKNTMC